MTTASGATAAAAAAAAVAADRPENEDEVAALLRQSGHELVKLTVISSTHISGRVAAVLEKLLSSGNDPSAEGKSAVIIALTAKAKVASKLISIVEIAKRELVKQGVRWFQYNVVSSTTVVLPREEERRQEGSASEDDEAGDEAFEPLKPKIRNVPVLTVYLARVSIRELKTRYGEQT